ncbi:MAG: ABC transporter substrate-binding protein [Thermodesulfobacteriota bacterium]
MSLFRSLIIGLPLLVFAVPNLGGAATVTDQAGRTVTIPHTPKRIIALAPSLVEIVYDLGEGSRLVGATQFSDFPAEAQRLPRVGSYVRLDLERIVALSPDLCLGIKEGNPKHQVEKIEATGIPVYVIDPRDLAGVMEAIRGVGAVLGVATKAEAVAVEMAGRIEKVRRRAAAATTRPRVFFQLYSPPIVTAGDNTFTHEMITLAGGLNLGAGPVAYPRFSWEEVLARDPEVVVVTAMGGKQAPEHLLAQWRQWPQLSAMKNGRIHVVEDNLFDRPTRRLIDGLEALARIIHPELHGAGDVR